MAVGTADVAAMGALTSPAFDCRPQQARATEMAMRTKLGSLDRLGRMYRHCVRVNYAPAPAKARTFLPVPLPPSLAHARARGGSGQQQAPLSAKVRGGSSATKKRMRPQVWQDDEVLTLLEGAQRLGLQGWHDTARLLPHKHAADLATVYGALFRGTYQHAATGLTSLSFDPGTAPESHSPDRARAGQANPAGRARAKRRRTMWTYVRQLQAPCCLPLTIPLVHSNSDILRLASVLKKHKLDVPLAAKFMGRTAGSVKTVFARMIRPAMAEAVPALAQHHGGKWSNQLRQQLVDLDLVPLVHSWMARHGGAL